LEVAYGFPLVMKLVTLTDLEQRNGRYFALFQKSLKKIALNRGTHNEYVNLTNAAR